MQFLKISITIFASLFLINVFASNDSISNTQSEIAEIIQNDSVIILFQNQTYHGVAKNIFKNKIEVSAFIDSKKSSIELKKKNVFTPNSNLQTNIPEIVRFRYESTELAEDIILKGRVIAYNKNYLLLEFEHNKSKIIQATHRSYVVQRDLSKSRKQ